MLVPGTGTACTRDAQCNEPDEICFATWPVGEAAAVGRCREAVPGGAAPGEACDEQTKCVESETNPGEKHCGKPCDTGADCPEGFSCVDLGGGTLSCKPGSDTCVPQ